MESALYYPKRKARDENARADYFRMFEKDSEDGIYIRDLMKGGR